MNKKEIHKNKYSKTYLRWTSTVSEKHVQLTYRGDYKLAIINTTVYASLNINYSIYHF